MYARDIENCCLCAIPILPGEQITVSKSGSVSHTDHWTEKAYPARYRELQRR